MATKTKNSFRGVAICLIALSSIFGCASNNQQEHAIVKTKGGNLLLRTEPSLQAEVVKRIPNNTQVEFHYCCCKDKVDGRQGKWCRIKHGGQEGYAWGWYLQLEGERISLFEKDCQCQDKYNSSGKIYQLSTPSRREEKIFRDLLELHEIPRKEFAICATRGLVGSVAYVKHMRGKKYVIYDRGYFDSVWDAYSTIILSHELGHFILDHRASILAPRKKQEIEADEFSGMSMFLMGYSLPESLQIMSSDQDGTDDYPSNAERRSAIETGWNLAAGK